MKKHDKNLSLYPGEEEDRMRPSAENMWELNGEDSRKRKLIVKAWVIYWDRDFDGEILHCREGELKFAEFWGRLLVAADKYCVEDLISLGASRLTERLSVWSAPTMLKYASLASHAKRERLGSYRWRVLVRKLLRCAV